MAKVPAEQPRAVVGRFPQVAVVKAYALAALLSGLGCRHDRMIGRRGSRDIMGRQEKPRAGWIEPPGIRTVVGQALWQAQQNVN